MENKVKRKRKISVLTIFLWIALVVTMSVVVISGINKSNALEGENTELKTITLKIDFSELLKNENYDEESKRNVIENMSNTIKFVDAKENIDAEQNIEYEIENTEINDGIVTYEVNITNGEANFVMFENNNEIWNEYTILENNSRLIDYTKNNIKYIVKELENEKNVYEFKVEKNVIKTLTIKVDHSMWIKLVEEQYKDNPSYLNIMISLGSRSNFYMILCDKDGNDIGNRSRYINIENNVATYEIDMLNGLSYEGINICFRSLLGMNNYERYYLIEKNNPLQIIDVPYGNVNSAIFRRKIDDKQDVYEFSFEKTRPVIIKIDYSNIDDEDKKEFMEYSDIDIFPEKNSGDNRRKSAVNSFIFKLIEKNDNYVTYEAYLLPIEYEIEIPLYYMIRKYGIYNDKSLLEERYQTYGTNYYKKINLNNTQNELVFVIKKKEPKITSDIKWENNMLAKLQYNIQGGKEFYNQNGIDMPEYRIFKEKLDENFIISQEYENDSKWLIVNEEEIMNEKIDYKSDLKSDNCKELILNIENSENIPEYVFAIFFKYYATAEHETYWINGIYPENEKKYIYIKDKNIVYYLNDANKTLENIDLKYIGNDIDISNKKFKFNTDVICLYRYLHGSGIYDDLQYVRIPVNQKGIEYEVSEKTEIVVNKIVKDERGNNKYYVGLFENDKDEVTDKIYEIETEDGVGSIRIEIENFDKSKGYYVYEVDENGNKIEYGIEYSKNRVLENENIVDRYKILSNKDVVSSVITIPEIENDERIIKSLNGGEEKYIDNSLLYEKVNEDTVTIAPMDLHIVKYETEYQGILDGKTKEAVKHGEKPVNVPSVIANDGYEFDKWVVIKDGEEIEVNPSEYVVLEDTTFIAKYKGIKIEENRDTSDINIWLYVGIAVISVIAIVIVVMIMKINKKRKTLEKR